MAELRRIVPQRTGANIPDDEVRHWMDQAACHQAELSLFFPRGGKAHHNATLKALEMCRGCPVREPCAEYALDNNEFGTWGGLTLAERTRIKKRRRNDAEAPNEDEAADAAG